MEFSTMISKARYECVVCRLNSSTLADLHRHQTYRHTSEELSLSSIVLRSSIINRINTSDGTSFVHPLLRNPQRFAELYAYSAKLLNDGKNNVHHIVPINYALNKNNDSISNEPFPSILEHRQTERELKLQKLLYRRSRFMSKGVLDLSCKISPLGDERKTHCTTSKRSKRKVLRKPRNVVRIQQSPKKNVVPVEVSPTVEDVFEEMYPKSVKINRQRKKTALARNKKSTIKVKLGDSTKANAKRGRTLPIASNDEHDRGELNLEDVKIRLNTITENLDALNAKKCSTKRKKALCIEPNEQDEPEEIQPESTKIIRQTKRSAPRKTKVTSKKRPLTRKAAKSRTKRGKTPMITWVRDTNDRKEVIGEKEINDSQNKEESSEEHWAGSKRKFLLSKSRKFGKITNTTESATISKDDGEEIHSERSKINQSENIDETLVLCKAKGSLLTDDTLQSSKTFPFYPPNMDERSILVLDPVLDELVWTTLILSDDTSSDHNNNDDSGKCTTEIMIDEDNSQKIQNYDESESILTVKPSQQNLLSFDEDTTNSERDYTSEIYDNMSSDGEYAWHHTEHMPNGFSESSCKIDDTGFLFGDEETLPLRYDVARPKRMRSTPDRFVPY